MNRTATASMLLAFSWGTFSFGTISSLDLPAQYLPVVGGSGGTAFTRDCGAGMVMTGIRGREGLLVDAVTLFCRPVGSDGTLGSVRQVGLLAGGGDSPLVQRKCEAGWVVSGAIIYHGMFVDGMDIHCQRWNASKRNIDVGNVTFVGVLGRITGTGNWYRCGDKKQPASGIRGRAAAVVDAIGLICDEP